MTGASQPWLTILGLGEDGPDGLSPAARVRLDAAEVLAGGARHLALIPDDGRERLAWPSPLAAGIEAILARRGRKVCVLATGDPLHYGVGATLARRVDAAEMTIVPAPSAFSLACARLAWPREAVACLSLHGRPLELLHPAVQPGARILALGHDGGTPAQVAALLVARGYGDSRITVLERLGGPRERRVAGLARDWNAPEIAPFHTLAIACVAAPGAAYLPRTPGLPDAAFRHDGQMTKREVRAVTLAALAPAPGQLLWDVGAGCGSVAIEWLRADPRNRAVAIEKDARRVALMTENAASLGVPNLQIVMGAAPLAFTDLAPPDVIFLGGGLSAPGLAAACWAALGRGGRLVANAVTLEGEAALAAFRAAHGGELTRIAVSRAQAVGRFTAWRALMPVTQLRAEKP